MRILNFIVIGQYTINIPEIFQVFTVFCEFDSKRGCHFLPKTGIEFVFSSSLIFLNQSARNENITSRKQKV